MEMIRFADNPRDAITTRGFAWVPRPAWSFAPALVADLERLRADWEDLELDRYLAGGARFRFRRYGRAHWEPSTDTLTPLADEPYLQPEDENA